jgi:hypothetical protein
MKRRSSLRQTKGSIPCSKYISRGLVCFALLALMVLSVAAVRNTEMELQPAHGAVQSSKSSTSKSNIASSPAVTISGLVRQPLQLGLRDLQAFDMLSVRRVDYRKTGFFGDFEFRGVPLRELILLADPWKKSGSFLRPTDLAIIVRNDLNQSALFSYGELLFRSPNDIILAVDAETMMPKRSCDTCHSDRSDHEWRKALNRKPVLPRIVARCDLDADRSIEGVTNIEVVELYSPAGQTDSNTKPEQTPSTAIKIRNSAATLATINNLESYSRHSVHALEVGDAMGYHGEMRCEGAYLTDVLTSAKAESGPDVGYVIVATDGYRALISSAELFSTVQPPPILIADRCNEQILEKDGAFKVIVANDNIAERWVKSTAEIEVVRAAPPNPR